MRGGARGAPTAAVALALLLLAESARTQAQSAALAVRLPPCETEPFPYEEFVQSLRGELALDGSPDLFVSPGDAPAPARGTSLTLSCACSPHAATVRFDTASASGTVRHRDVPLHDLPWPVRGRALALVAAELVRASLYGDFSAVAHPSVSGPAGAAVPLAPAASSSTAGAAVVPSANPQSAPLPIQAQPRAGSGSDATRHVMPPPAPAPMGSSQTTLDFGVAGQARVFTPTTTTTAGARVYVRVGAFTAGADWLTRSVRDTAGTARGDIFAGWLALVVWRTTGTGWRADLGPRASFGTAVAQGSASDGAHASTAREPYFDAALQLDARWAFSDAGGLLIGLDAGVARGMIVSSDNRALAALGGWFAGAHVGLEARP